MSDVTDFHDFQYHFDYLTGWTELLENQLPGDEWSDVLRAAGYNPYPNFELGLADSSPSCKLYSYDSTRNSTAKAKYDYLIEIDITDGCRFVFCSNLPSVLEILSKVAGIVHVGLHTGLAEDLEALIIEQRRETDRLLRKRHDEQKAAKARRLAEAEEQRRIAGL